MQQPFSPQSFQAPANPNQALNLTGADLGSHLMTASRGAGGLNIQFFYNQVAINGRGGRPARLETRLCVAKQPKGDRFTIACTEITEEEAMREFPQEFVAFKRYQEVPTNGTPLHELPGISQSQIAILTLNGLRSVEDLADLSTDTLSQVGMEATHAHRLAVNWLKRRDASAETIRLSEIEAARAQEKAEAEARMEALEKQNNALQGQIQALLTRLGGAMGAATPASYQNVGEPIAVEARPDLPSIDDMPGFDASSGGMATGLDDLLTGDPDPLAG